MNKFQTGVLIVLVLVMAASVFLLMGLSSQVAALKNGDQLETQKDRELREFKSEIQEITTSFNANRQQLGVPVGVIMAFSGDISLLPYGWLPCDGRTIPIADYPDLYRIIKAQYGGVDDVLFQLPDLRGRFLRGVDHGAGRDPDAARRIADSQTGQSGDVAGTTQKFSTALPETDLVVQAAGDHYHGYHDVFWMECYGTVNVTKKTGSSGGDDDNRGCEFFRDTHNSGKHTHLVTGGDLETRPTNISVEWIIKVL